MILLKLTLKECIICKSVLDTTPQELLPLPCSYVELSLNLVVLGSTKQNVVLLRSQEAQSHVSHSRSLLIFQSSHCQPRAPPESDRTLSTNSPLACEQLPRILHVWSGPQVDTVVESREMAGSVVQLDHNVYCNLFESLVCVVNVSLLQDRT